MCLMEKLINLIKNSSELKECMNETNVYLEQTFLECYNSCLNKKQENDPVLLFKIDSLLDYLHDELNTGHWSEVPVNTRQAFTSVSFIKALVLVGKESGAEAALKSIDLGLLLGAPLVDNYELLTQSATLLTKSLNKSEVIDNHFKRKQHNSPSQINGKDIKILERPSIDLFNQAHFKPQIPVILKDCISHWPATKNWFDMNYLLNLAGCRTVPIEIGSRYTDENWTQKLMSLKEFILNHYLNVNTIGYLAQHNLFDQIPELREDIRVPDYCALSRDYDDNTEPDINAWLGPEGTVSPLHYDPKDNLLAQVYGTKQIVLFSPNDSEYLYPHGDKLLLNTSQVDPYKPDLNSFPKYNSATLYKCLLEPGDVLYIPLKWWHHVTALEKSFSVSFWWK